MAHEALDATRLECAETARELSATRLALEALRTNFDAAEGLLNDELQARERMEGRLRAEDVARGRFETEAKHLAARVSVNTKS